MARDELIVGIGADISGLEQEVRRGARVVENLDKLFAQPTIVPPPDFTEWIQAADVVRAEFDQIISANQIGQRAAAAAKQGADAIHTGFLGRMQELQDLITTGLISPQDFAKQADLALEAFGREVAAKQAQLPPLILRATVATTGPNVIDPDELRQAEQAFARTTGEADRAAAAQTRFARSATQGTKGLTLLRSGFAQYATFALGARSSTASLAQGILFSLGVGSGTMIAALAGVTALTELLKHLTSRQREAKESAEKHLEVLRKLREEQRDPAAVVGESVASGEAALNTLRERIQRVADLQQNALNRFLQGNGEAFAQAQRFASRLLDLNREYLELLGDVGAGIQKVGQLTAETDDARIERMTALLSLGAAVQSEEAELARILAASRAELARTTAADEKSQQRRLELRQRIAAIEGAQKDALELDTKPAIEAAKALREEVQATATSLQRAQEAATGLSQPFTLRLDVGAALDDIRTLQGQVDAMIARFQRLGLGTTDLEGLRDQLRQMLAAADPTSLEAMAKAAEALSTRLGILQGDLGSVLGQEDALRGTTALLVQEYSKLVAEIERQGGALSASTGLLEQAGKAVAALGPDSAPFTAGLGAAITKLREAEARLREFTALGISIPGFKTDLEVDVETARAQVAAFLAESQARLDQRVFSAVLNIEISEDPTSTEFMLRALEATGEAGRKLARQLRDPVSQAEKLRNALIDVADSVAAFHSIADSLGLIGDEGARALQAIEGLAEASARFASGDILGGILGGLTSIAALGGPSEQEQERNRLLEENNDRMAELSAALNENIKGAAGLENIRAVLQALTDAPELLNRVQRNDQNILNKGRFQDEVDEFQRILREAGVSLEELDQIARDNGINLLDDEGRILAGAFADLIPILNETIRELTTFGDSLADQRTILETQRALAGADVGGVGQLEIDRELLLENLNLGEAIERQIASLDLTAEGGQEAFRQFLQDLFDKGLEGFDPSELEGEVTARDILQIIGGSADALNELAEGAREATDSMLNVPTGFKLAATRFAAELPETLMAAVPGMPLVPVMAGDGAQLPLLLEALQSAGAGATINIENVNLDTKGKATPELARDLVRELRNMSQAKFGTTNRWGEL